MLGNEVIADKQHDAVYLNPDQPKLIKKVIRQLIPSWSLPQSRREKRHTKYESVALYPGINRIISALLFTESEDSFKNTSDINPALKAFDLSEATLSPIESTLPEQHIDRSNSSIHSALKRTIRIPSSSVNIWQENTSKKIEEKSTSMSAKVNDTSLQGLNLSVNTDNKPLLRVTDLIGIQAKNETIQLALIRRINKLDDESLSIGVEIVSSNLNVVNVTATEKNSPTKPAIFLQGSSHTNQADSIICPFIIENKNSIVLFGSDKYFSIEKTLEENQMFSHYSVLKNT